MPQDRNQSRQVSLDEWERMTFEKYGVPENLRRSIAEQESGGDVQAKSPTGVRGRYQVTKATAAQYGYDRDNPWEHPVAAAKHLRTLYDGVRKRHPGFSDKQVWLGASAEYYGGAGSVDADGNLSTKSRDGYSTPAKYATSIAERWSSFDRGDSGGRTRDAAPLRPQGAPKEAAASRPQYDEQGRRKLSARDLGIEPVEWEPGKVFHLPTGEFIEPSRQSKYTPPRSRADLEIAPRALRPRAGATDAPTASLRRGAIESLIHQFEGRKEEAARLLSSSDEQKRAQGRAVLQSAQNIARDAARRGAGLVEAGADDGGWPYVKFRDPERQARSAEFDYRRGGMFAADRARSERAALEIGPEVSAALRKMEEFEREPWSEQWERRIQDAVERGGSEGGRLVLRALGAGLGAARTLNSGKFEVQDVTPERFKKNDERMARENAARREAYRPSFAGDVVEGIAEGAPQAAGATILGGITGGGLPAMMAIGGGMSALGADWEKDPERAAAQTVLGAVAPVVGGKIGQKAAGRVASRFTAPASQAATRMAGEIGGGSVGNVLQSGAETAAFEGLDQISSRELAKQAAVGAGLSTPGAPRSLRPASGLSSLRPTAEADRAEIPVLDPAPRTPEARTGVASQIRAMGPVAEEAAIRAGLEAQETASTPRPAPEPQRLPFDAEAARRIQHSQFGEVFEAGDQAGVRRGHLRVIDGEGRAHVIKNPRTAGNREASFITEREEAMRGVPELPELPAIEEAPGRAGLSTRERGVSAAVEGPRLGLAALDIGAQTPEASAPGLRGRIAETLGGVQMAAQLGSPRFVIRNVLQHVAFGKQERAATRLAAALDWAYSKTTGKGRQILAPRGSDLASYARNWKRAVEAYKRGEDLPGRPNEDYLTADSNAIDRGVNKLMTWVNEIPDAAQWQTRFEQSLESIVEGAKRSKKPIDMDAAIDQARIEADRASLRDPNFISTALRKIKESLNTASSPIFGTDKFGVGDFILKYARTPGALLRRGLDRSPLGLFTVAREAARPGPFRRRNTLMALSRVAEGAASGLGLGAALAAGGILVGPEEEGRTGRALEREEGVRGYSINTSALVRLLTGDSTELREGDTLYSVDWLQPWAMNLSAGGALWNLHKRGEMGPGKAAGAAGEAVYDSLAKTLDVASDQSVLKNLSRYMSRATGENFSDRALSFFREIGLDVPSSFVPSLARSARQAIDPYERDTRAEDRTGVRGFAREAANRAISQLPGASNTLPTRPSILTGEPKKTAAGSFQPAARALMQISPANISAYQPHPVAREAARLRDHGFKVEFTMPRREKDEPTGVLRGRERRFAETFSKAATRMLDAPDYRDASDRAKAEAWSDLAKHLRLRTRKQIDELTIEEIVERAVIRRERAEEREAAKN